MGTRAAWRTTIVESWAGLTDRLGSRCRYVNGSWGLCYLTKGPQLRGGRRILRIRATPTAVVLDAARGAIPPWLSRAAVVRHALAVTAGLPRGILPPTYSFLVRGRSIRARLPAGKENMSPCTTRRYLSCIDLVTRLRSRAEDARTPSTQSALKNALWVSLVGTQWR